MKVIVLAALAALAAAQFTGRVDVDFTTNDPLTKRVSDLLTKDVGLPSGLLSAGMLTSGYDIEYIMIRVNTVADELNIGVKCFVICGDADGNGNPDSTSAQLSSLGGIDQVNFAFSESALVAFDFGTDQGGAADGALDFIIGYPASESLGSAPFPCNRDTFDQSCFGVYRYQNGLAYSQPQYRFQWRNGDAALGASPTTHGRDDNPARSAAAPGLEWTFTHFNQMLAAGGFPLVDYSGVRPWRINLLAFQGSFDDDGIGEDFLPGSNQVITVEWPCRTFDACGVCGGNNMTCADCARVPNGNARYDVCDVCNGNGLSCLDCARVPNGPARYDVCDVCNGNGQSCRDCRGVANGPARYDVCDVCGGNGQSCLDCRGIPNGPNRYDVCDVCAGNGQTCRDCAGMANGPARYDVCDVCNGNGQSCLDCAGTPFGHAVYDDCGVCNGDGKSCRCDGALLTKSCDQPLQLLRSVPIRYNNQRLVQETWLDPWNGERQTHYWHALTEVYYGDASSVNTAQISRDCTCP